jgi:hypothetical protein
MEAAAVLPPLPLELTAIILEATVMAEANEEAAVEQAATAAIETSAVAAIAEPVAEVIAAPIVEQMTEPIIPILDEPIAIVVTAPLPLVEATVAPAAAIVAVAPAAATPILAPIEIGASRLDADGTSFALSSIVVGSPSPLVSSRGAPSPCGSTASSTVTSPIPRGRLYSPNGADASPNSAASSPMSPALDAASFQLDRLELSSTAASGPLSAIKIERSLSSASDAPEFTTAVAHHLTQKPKFVGEFELMESCIKLRADALAAVTGASEPVDPAAIPGVEYLLYRVDVATREDRVHPLGKVRLHVRLTLLDRGPDALTEEWRQHWLHQEKAYQIVLAIRTIEQDRRCARGGEGKGGGRRWETARGSLRHHRCSLCALMTISSSSPSLCLSLPLSAPLSFLLAHSPSVRVTVVEWTGSSCPASAASTAKELSSHTERTIRRALPTTKVIAVRASKIEQVTYASIKSGSSK